VGCAISYILLFLFPIIYLNYFWCIKYQHIIIYMKMGKRNRKRKRKGFSCLLGRGEILAHPGASACAGARQEAQPAHQRGRRRRGAGPHVSEGRGLTARSSDGGGRSTGARPPVKSRGGSPPWVRFLGGGGVAGPGGGGGPWGWGQFDRWRPRVAGPRRGGGYSRR
jgi:hypothetical protein